MNDDVFKLGNFEDLKGSDMKEGFDKFDQLDEDMTQEVSEDMQRIQEKLEDPENPSPPTSPSPSSQGGELIRHPTVRSDPQAKFRDHAGKPLLEIDVNNIVPNEFQPRRIFDPTKLQELADSIKEHGIIQPIVVTERSDGKYEILVGERRFRASKLAGLKTVPALLSPKIDSETKLEIALIENVQRAELNPIEEARAYQRLLDEFGLKVGEIAHKVGKNSSTVSNLLRLLNLPVEVQRALIEEKIAEGQARPLLTLRDKDEMLEMFKVVLREGMKVRDIEAKVREISRRKIKVREMFTPDPFLTSLENMLRGKLGTRVEVSKGAKGAGHITIEFFSDEELNNIVGKIT